MTNLTNRITMNNRKKKVNGLYLIGGIATYMTNFVRGLGQRGRYSDALWARRSEDRNPGGE